MIVVILFFCVFSPSCLFRGHSDGQHERSYTMCVFQQCLLHKIVGIKFVLRFVSFSEKKLVNITNSRFIKKIEQSKIDERNETGHVCPYTRLCVYVCVCVCVWQMYAWCEAVVVRAYYGF